jgi:hypothetical protein
MPTQHYVWSDGCVRQFKSTWPFYFVSQYPKIIGDCGMSWSFFGTSHGKGKHDGASAMVKQVL